MPDRPPPADGIVFDRVSKTFANGTRALADLSLALRPGEFVALIGPSGCGKSTLLRLAAGLDRVDAGRVAVAEGGLGFVFQDPTLMPWASVADNVALPLVVTRHRARDIAPKVAAALARVGLAEVARALPHVLSGGMRMRVSIARALVTEPRILLMDEPFAALDEITRFDLDAEILRLADDARRTVLFVTHSVGEAVFLADRVVVMAAGPGRIHAERRIAFDHPRDAALRDRPAFVAACAEVSALLRHAMAASPQGGRVDAAARKG